MVNDLIQLKDFKRNMNNNSYFGPFIQITFHSDFDSLLQEFYGSTEIFADDSFNAGGLVRQPDFASDTSAQLQLASMLGILPNHTTASELGFVLTRFWKVVSQYEAYVSINEKYVDEFMNIDRNQSENILSLFSKYGTHYLSEYTEGDYIYQVFVYQKDVFDFVESNYPDDKSYRNGLNSVQFRYYTKERKILPDGSIGGFTEYVGDILAASGDPALERIIPSLFDRTYQVFSILMIATSEELWNETKSLKKTIPSKTRLGSISEIIYTEKKVVNNPYQAWNGVLRASIFQKFDSSSSPGFYPVSEAPKLQYYSPFNPELVTSTATSFTAILQDSFDLSDLKIINPKFVTDLFIIADIIELKRNADVKLPGSNSVYIICTEFVSNASDSIVPKISIGNSHNSPKFTLIVDSFKGTLELSDNKDRVTVSDGTIFETVAVESGSFSIVSNPLVRLPLPTSVPELYTLQSIDYRDMWLARSFLNGLHLLTTRVETMYSLQLDDSVEIAKESLDWMILTLTTAKNETVLSADLEVLLSRLLLLKKLIPNPNGPVQLVPKLTFPQYQELYDRLLDDVSNYENELDTISREISERMQTEAIIDSQEELNENVLEIGKFLVGEVTANYQNYVDINDSYTQIQNHLINDLEAEMQTSAELFQEVLNYTDNVKVAGDKFHRAVKRAAAFNIAMGVLGACTAIGGMFTGFVDITSIPEEFEGIKRVSKKVGYVSSMTAEVTKIYDLGKNIHNEAYFINNGLENMPDMSEYTNYFPSDLDWSDFDADVLTLTTSYTRCCVPQGAEYRNQATKLSARGRLFLKSQEKVTSLQYQIVLNNMKFFVLEQQMERLKKLEDSMNQEKLDDYQANTTDLYEFGNILQTQINEVRMKLAQTYVTMDAALQYYYLKPPTPLTGYDTHTIQNQAVNQMADAIAALESFISTPTELPKPIVYKIPRVPVFALTRKKGFQHRIPLSASEFMDYSRVRIKEIKVTIDSIKSADKDAIFIECNYTGVNFQDRGLNRETKKYTTMTKVYRYVYNYTNMETIVGTRPEVDDVFVEMTPFGEWIFSIPKLKSSSSNVNITYSKRTTTVRVEFYLSVVYNPPRSRSPNTADPCSTDPTSTQCLLSKTYHSSVANEWDAIMTMDAQRVNELWADKYKYQEEHGGLAYNITTDWKETNGFPIRIDGRFSGLVEAPEIQFVDNNPKVIIMKMIMHGVIYQTRMKYSGQYIYNETEYTDDFPIKSQNTLTKMRGSVVNQDMVVVDLTSSIVDVEIEDVEGQLTVDLANAIEIFFTEKLNSSSYDLGTIDYDSSVTPPAFQPSQFLFSTGGSLSSSSGKGSLIICIMTHSSRGSDEPEACDLSVLSKELNSIIPSGYTAALFIASEVIFRDLIQPKFEEEFGPGSSVQPYDNKNSAYQLTSDTGEIKDIKVTYYVRQCYVTSDKELDIAVKIPANNSQFAIDSSEEGSLRLKWNSDWKQSIKYWSTKIDPRSGCFEKGGDVDAQFHLKANEQKSAQISEDDIISFPPFKFENSDISHDHIHDHKDTYELERDKNAAADKCANAIEKRISGLGFSISPFSAFALTNIIFPNEKVMNMKVVYIPGDLLVLGDVDQEYKPSLTYK